MSDTDPCGGCLGEAAEYECRLNAGWYDDPEYLEEYEAFGESDALEILEYYFHFTKRQVDICERKKKGVEAFQFMQRKIKEAKKQCLKECKIY